MVFLTLAIVLSNLIREDASFTMLQRHFFVVELAEIPCVHTDAVQGSSSKQLA